MSSPIKKTGGYVFKSWLDATSLIDEKFYGPLPDVVSTQGRYLKPQPNTPVLERKHDPQFTQKLQFILDGLFYRQYLRRGKYGDEVAEEWPPGHTPTEIREQWKAEQEEDERRVQALLEIPTPPTPEDVRLEEARLTAERRESHVAREAHKAMKKRKRDEALSSSGDGDASTSVLPPKRPKHTSLASPETESTKTPSPKLPVDIT